MKRSVFLLGEDAFCLSVLEKLMAVAFPGVMRKSLPPACGKEKVKPTVGSFKKSGVPLIVLADSDSSCPVTARRSIEGSSSPNVLMRMAVREADAWVLGDVAIADFLDAPVAKLARNPELLPDPKEELIRFAGYSKSPTIRRQMTRGFLHQSQPPGYNGLIPKFVFENWNPSKAASRCPSLARALRSLERATFLR